MSAAELAITQTELAGAWRWLHAERDGDVEVIEREQWSIDLPGTDGISPGRYRRDVAVISLDGTPFLCNQQAAYVQTAVYDVRVRAVDGVLHLEELAYRTAPSPCEAGFRELADYTLAPSHHALVLAWDGGEQTLERAAAADTALPAPAAPLAGAWHWNLRTRDGAGHAREEDEAWELAVAADGTLAGTYVRTVTTWTEDGSTIPCAGAGRWRFTDRYTVAGTETRLEETAVDRGTHPCIAPTPERHLDAALVDARAGHLTLVWRGARKQVLHRR